MATKDPNFRPHIYEELIRHLLEKNELFTVLKYFSWVKTNEGRVHMAYYLLEQNKMLPKLSVDKKNDQKSEEFRQTGNEWFKKKNAKKSHEFYTKSVAFAESGSQNLALAYANRSAVLFENGLYQECLIDINLALNNHYPEKLLSKLLARQAKATELLPTQEKVDFYTPVPYIPKERQNPLIQSAMDSIKIEHSRTFGRHIVATKDIEPGEIIAIEKPFCQALIDQFFTHCHHCLNLCYTLIPCDTCTEAMFCSESCKLTSYQSYHQFECKILLTTRHMEISWQPNLRIAIVARNKYDELSSLVPGKNGMYRSDRYEEIYHLAVNTDKRSVSDLFNRAVIAAALFHLLKANTDFFKTEDSEAIFKDLLIHHMQSDCNFHAILENRSCDKSTEGNLIGSGVYSFLSMFNHSCCPNVVRSTYGSTNVVIALESIKKGEQCFDNYGYYYGNMSKPDRQINLQERYLFTCECLACTNNYPFFELLLSENDLTYLGLENGDLGAAKILLQKTIDMIKRAEKTKPNIILAEMHEALKLIYFIFSTIKTPI